MSLFERIKEDRNTARKAKDTIAINALTTLVGELEGSAKRSGNTVSDELVLQTCKKFIDNINDTLKLQITDETIVRLQQEHIILNKYRPLQLSEQQLYTIIVELSENNVGKIMQHLKTNYAGQYDGTLASVIAKNIAVGHR